MKEQEEEEEEKEKEKKVDADDDDYDSGDNVEEVRKKKVMALKHIATDYDRAYVDHDKNKPKEKTKESEMTNFQQSPVQR